MFSLITNPPRAASKYGINETNDRLWDQIRRQYGPLMLLILYKLSGNKFRARDIINDAFKVCKLKKVVSRAPIPLCQHILRYGFRRVIQYLRASRRETRLNQLLEDHFHLLNLVYFELASCQLVSWQLGLTELDVRLGLKNEMRLLKGMDMQSVVRESQIT